MKRLDFVLNFYKLLASNLLGVVLVIFGVELFLLLFYFFYDHSVKEKSKLSINDEIKNIMSKFPQD